MSFLVVALSAFGVGMLYGLIRDLYRIQHRNRSE